MEQLAIIVRAVTHAAPQDNLVCKACVCHKASSMRAICFDLAVHLVEEIIIAF